MDAYARLEHDAKVLQKYGIRLNNLTCRCDDLVYGNGEYAQPTLCVGQIYFVMEYVGAIGRS